MTTPLVGSWKDCPNRDCDLDAESHETCLALQIPGHQCLGPLSHAHVPPAPRGGRVQAILCLFGAHLPADQGLNFLSGTKRRVKHWLYEEWTCDSELGTVTVPGNAPCGTCRDRRIFYVMSDRETNEELIRQERELGDTE